MRRDIHNQRGGGTLMRRPSSSAIFANGEIADGCRNMALTPLSDVRRSLRISSQNSNAKISIASRQPRRVGGTRAKYPRRKDPSPSRVFSLRSASIPYPCRFWRAAPASVRLRISRSARICQSEQRNVLSSHGSAWFPPLLWRAQQLDDLRMSIATRVVDRQQAELVAYVRACAQPE
jgi:hypothetical protein